MKGVKDIILNFTPIEGGRLNQLVQTAYGAMKNPWWADLVSEMGDLSGTTMLKEVRWRMLVEEEGREILKSKPWIRTESEDLESLQKLAPHTFGYQYFHYMENHGFSADERPLAKYIPDPELAYVYQRYKEVHDYLHTLLNYGIEVEDELAVKWFEMAQTGLPVNHHNLLECSPRFICRPVHAFPAWEQKAVHAVPAAYFIKRS